VTIGGNGPVIEAGLGADVAVLSLLAAFGVYTDLSEVMALAAQGKIRHTLNVFTFNQINEYIDLLRKGDVVGRAVMKF